MHFSRIPSRQSGVNFTNILWAAFPPKSFRQKITNPNCKHTKAVQRALVWLSISPIFYMQLFHNKVLCTPFMCLQFGFVIFWPKDFCTKAAHKMLVKLTPERCLILPSLGHINKHDTSLKRLARDKTCSLLWSFVI